MGVGGGPPACARPPSAGAGAVAAAAAAAAAAGAPAAPHIILTIGCRAPRQGISDIITSPGLINIDFADVKAVMSNSGTAMLGGWDPRGRHRPCWVGEGSVGSAARAGCCEWRQSASARSPRIPWPVCSAAPTRVQVWAWQLGPTAQSSQRRAPQLPPSSNAPLSGPRVRACACCLQPAGRLSHPLPIAPLRGHRCHGARCSCPVYREGLLSLRSTCPAHSPTAHNALPLGLPLWPPLPVCECLCSLTTSTAALSLAGIVYNITGGQDMTLQEVNRVSEVRLRALL